MATVGLTNSTAVVGLNSASSTMSARSVSRVQCYLCDLPHSPWAILQVYSEPVCRGCCNYEGSERIEEAIQRARGLRTLYPNAVAAARNRGSPNNNSEVRKTEPNSAFLPSSLSHMTLMNHPLFRNGITPPTNSNTKSETKMDTSPDTSVKTDHDTSPKTSPKVRSPTAIKTPPAIPVTDAAVVSRPDSTVSPATSSVALISHSSPVKTFTTTATSDTFKTMAKIQSDNLAKLQSDNIAKLHSERLSLPSNFTSPFNLNRDSSFSSMFPVIVPPLAPRYDAGRALQMMKDKALHDQFPPPIVRDILTVLNSCVPFIVRFNKDHSLKGRVFSFEAIRKTTDYELRIYTEYPIGSNSVYQSASGASRQMYGEYRERMNIGRGRIGASSNGFRDLEYERVPNSGQWLLLGELLPDLVRYLKAMPDPRYLPQPVTFPNMPPPPLPRCNTSKYTRMKRVKVEEEKNDAKKICLDKGRLSWGGNELWMQQPIFGSRLPLHADALSVYSQLSLSNLSKSESAFSPTTSTATPVSGSLPVQTTALPTATVTIPTSATSSPTHPRLSDGECKSDKIEITVDDKSEERRSPSPAEQAGAGAADLPAPSSPAPAEINCLNCTILLEGTDFVQCPSISLHKFCFSCTRTAIRDMLPGDVCCPSGTKCSLEGTTAPWTFMKREISTILASD